MLETSGESFGVPTPTGSVLPNRDHRKSGYRFRTQGREPRGAVHGIFDLLGDEFLDLLRGESRGLRLDVDLRRDELGKHIQGGPQRAPAAQNKRQYRERRNRAEVTHAQRDDCPHHGYSGSAPELDSRASSWPAAVVTTLSPAATPSVTK